MRQRGGFHLGSLLWNGADGGGHSAPDFLEGWLDLIGVNDEAVSSQLRSGSVLDASSCL